MFLSSVFGLVLIFYLGLASVGHRFFIHQFYVSKLLKLFDYGQKRIAKVDQKLHQNRRNQRRLSLATKQHSQQSLNSFLKPTLSNQSISEIDSGESSSDSALGEDFDFQEQFDAPISFLSNQSMEKKKQDLNTSTLLDLINLGIKAIVDDKVTKRFDAEELKTWNLLTRTDKIYHYKSLRLAGIWMCGMVFRYLILFPIRLIIGVIGFAWLLMVTALIGLLPEGYFKRSVYYYCSIMCFRLLSRGVSAVITYHNPENRAKPGGICVANHTSPIDVLMMHCNNAFALVGQKQPGVLAILQRALHRATHHIWFDRFETGDRLAVSRRLREHATDKTKLPILIFPEGTCINNTSVMQFKKGSFEIDAPIYPVAIKYDARFCDPFWNSSKYGYGRYLLMMMTSWAIVCDIWFLPVMYREQNESAIDFASRVKAEIARKGGLVDLEWDGQLKRQKVKPDLIKLQQLKFSQSINVQLIE